MRPYILTLDIGTSSCKAAVFSERYEIIYEGKGTYPLYSDSSGNVEQDPFEILDGVIRAVEEIRKAGCRMGTIQAISFSSQISAQCLVGRDGKPITNILSWMDRRAWREAEDIERCFTKEEIIQMSGMDMIVTPAYSPAKLLWMKRNIPDKLASALHFVQIKEIVIHYLTGQWVSDANSLKGLVSPQGDPIDRIFKYIGTETSLIPSITKPYESAGSLKKNVVGFEDFRPGIKVITGWNDMNAAFLGMVGFSEKCIGLDITGTSEHIGIVRPLGDNVQKSYAGLNTVPFLSDHQAIYGVTSSGGQAADWFATSIMGKTSAGEYFAKIGGNGVLPPMDDDLICLPYIEGERNPVPIPKASGVFFGLKRKHTDADLARAVLEGVCFALRTICDRLPEKPEKYIISGGASKNSAWDSMKASVIGVPFESLYTTEAGCNGAAMLAAFALSKREEWTDIQKKFLKISQRFEVDEKEKARLETKYNKYLRLLECTKVLYKEDNQ